MSIAENIASVREQIESKRAALGISYTIEMIAVTKTHPASVAKDAIAAGLKSIGENRVQEAESKFAELFGVECTKHLIGSLQENKANKAATIFDFIQSVDSVKIAAKLANKSRELTKTLPVLIEVKTSYEATKSGIEPELLTELVGRIAEMPNLKLEGLMTIAPFTDDLHKVRESFRMLMHCREDLQRQYPALSLGTMSMGMSDDFMTAIEEGSTMVRLGRILFGSRG